MNGKCLVDANILAYAHDITQGVKHERARELINSLWESGDGVLSTQVLQELCVTMRRKTARPLSSENTRKLLEDYGKWPVVVKSVLEALDLETRYQISFWDALILQAAASCGAGILYSEDLAEGQKYSEVRVVNPLIMIGHFSSRRSDDPRPCLDRYAGPQRGQTPAVNDFSVRKPSFS